MSGSGNRPSWLALRLAGATWLDRIFAGLGALFGICVTGFITSKAAASAVPLPWIVAPMGASSVLVFAVPSSPLAQPWSVVGGNVISALVAVGVAQMVPDPVLATGVAVGLAIMAMSLMRCLHPPGGAVALMTVMAAQHSAAPNFFFAFAPVGVNSAVLAVSGWFFHRLTGHSYPHVAAPPPASLHDTRDVPPQLRGGFRPDDIDAVLADLHETFDIDRADLELLLRQVELRVFSRAEGPLTCADIMSRDLIVVAQDETVAGAREQMTAHRLHCMPAVNRLGLLVGMVEASDLIGEGDALVAAVMKEALVADPKRKVSSLVAELTTGRSHEVVVVDPDRRPLGLITQTDLLAAMARVSADG